MMEVNVSHVMEHRKSILQILKVNARFVTQHVQVVMNTDLTTAENAKTPMRC